MTNWKYIDHPIHPLENSRWVECVAHILKQSTGEVRRYITNEILDDDQDVPSPYIWEDGNYSCDCNRALFFGYANGEKSEEIEAECGEGAFQVNLENPVTGEIYYREFNEAPNPHAMRTNPA